MSRTHPVIYTGGTFDLFHEGHLELLSACRRMAGSGVVVAAVNTDDFIEEFKGRRPVMSYAERAKLLAACRYVDHVVPNIGGAASIDTIAALWTGIDAHDGTHLTDLAVDIVAIGTDWAARDYYGQMGFTREWLDERDIVLVYVDRRTGQSSTRIKDQIRA